MENQENIPILNKIKELPSSLTPFKVPENYFERLETIVLQKISNIEIEDDIAEYPLLKSISKRNPYHIPDNYLTERDFTQFRKKTYFINKWQTIAAAAMIATIIALGSISYITNHNRIVAKTNSNRIIQQLSMEELTNFADAEYDNALNAEDNPNIAEKNQIFKNISNQDLINFLSETDFNEGILN